MNRYDVIVVGAGASGMMAAYAAANNGKKVVIFEKNEKPGKKIFITGKGRCNITNASELENVFENIVSNRKFMYSAIYTMTNDDVIQLFQNKGLPVKTERGNRVFPVSDKSSDVINTLLRMLREKQVDICYNTEIKDIVVENNMVKAVILSNGEKVYGNHIIFATGGMSYPVTGSDGKGMQILCRYGHSIRKLTPALVPMNVKEEYIKDLQGLSLKNVQASFYRMNNLKKPVYEEFGEMLFTHFGVSGPIILSASSFLGKYIENENILLKIDLKPAITNEQLNDRLLREFDKNINKDFKNAIDDLLPKKMIPVIIKNCEIDPYKKVNTISKEERLKLLNILKGFSMTVTSFRGYNEAIITQGGISVKEVNPGTMESKIIKNLYIVGEMLDVDALTGGYNLQIAWSTGNLAGSSIDAG